MDNIDVDSKNLTPIINIVNVQTGIIERLNRSKQITSPVLSHKSYDGLNLCKDTSKQTTNESINESSLMNLEFKSNSSVKSTVDDKQQILEVLQKYKVKNISITNNENSEINKRVNKIYIINLLEDTYKRNYIITLMKKYDINYTLIVVERISPQLHKTIKCNGITRGELGCCLSHLWCLRDAISKNIKNMIIFEDDIILHKEFIEYFSHLYDNNPKLDFLMLGAHDMNFSSHNYKSVKNNLYVPRKGQKNLFGAHANYYSQLGARRMFYLRMSNLTFFDKEYNLLFDQFPNSYIAYPNLVVSNVSDSTLNHTREFFSKNELDYYKKCFVNFAFSRYNFLYVNLLKNIRSVEDNDSYTKITDRYLYHTFYDFDKIENVKLRLTHDFFDLNDIKNIINRHT